MIKSRLIVVPYFLFMALLLTPAIAAILPGPSVPPLQENRRLAEWPDTANYFGEDGDGLLAYTSQLERWFSDHFATRPFWVRAYTQILYTVFSDSDQLHVGEDNWLFYRSVIDSETPELDRISPETQTQMVERAARLTQLLEARGVTLYIVPVALKHAYYPEYLPLSAQHAKRFTFYDTYMDQLSQDSGVNLIDSRPILNEAKAAGTQIFHRTDFHWTDAAGALVMQDIVKAMAEDSGRPEVVERYEFRITDLAEFAGGQSAALPLFRRPTEVSIGVEALGPAASFEFRNNEDGIEWQGRTTADPDMLLDPVIVYADSFFDAGARAGFFYNFRAFARARIWQNDIVNLYENRPEGTRYMVIEYIASATAGVDSHVATLIAHLESEEA